MANRHIFKEILTSLKVIGFLRKSILPTHQQDAKKCNNLLLKRWSVEEFPLSHLPSVMLLIGYPIFWLEIFVFDSRKAVTTPLAAILFVLFVIYLCFKNSTTLSRFISTIPAKLKVLNTFQKIFCIAGFILSAVIVLLGLYASFLPPHLSQEYDVLNYHLTIPRQHLILGSFAHIPWSHADLFMLPVNFALSPYWFVTVLPNKLPQFIFLLGLLGVGVRLLDFFKANFLAKVLFVFAVVGSHGIGIQIGTAMLDLAISYLFFAALDSFLRGNLKLAALELAFCFWSKSFMPIQFIVIGLSVFVLFFMLRKVGFAKIKLGIQGEEQSWRPAAIRKPLGRLAVYFAIVSILIAGPFLIKSMYYSGTPLYPILPGIWKVNSAIDYNSAHWHSIVDSAREHLKQVKDYGHGRDLLSFVKHGWLIAVPRDGVNNAFDYPLGLPYLLFVGPFAVFFIRGLRKKELSIVPFFIIMYWLLWWMGSQQSRFLFIPLFLIFLIGVMITRSSRMLMAALILALLFNVLSVARAHKRDMGREVSSLLREKDRELLKRNELWLQDHPTGSYVELPFHDAAYAQFPVMVTQKKYPYVLEL